MLAASQTNRTTFSTAILIIMLGLLVGCSRDNPLSTPEAYVEPETPFCTDDSPFSFQLLQRVDFTNTNDDFTVVPDSSSDEPALESQDSSDQVSENNQKSVISGTAPFLANSTTITPIPLTDYKRNEQGEVVFNDENEPIIILLNKEVTQDMLDNLSEEAVAELEEFVPEVSSISYSISFNKNGEEISEIFDDELVSLNADLLEGVNNFTLKINARVIVPVSGLECVSYSDQISRGVNLNYEISYVVSRDYLDDFIANTLDTTGFQLQQNDELGNVIAINDDFLVLGVPNESSDFQEVRSIEMAGQNTNSSLSGAAFVFMKDEGDLWVPHSIIKSSNSEAGDRFGAAISLDGRVMAISAPGEDSNGAGIYRTEENNASVFKINNSAVNSGAVFIFTFDEETNSWKETHYIKPQENAISDGSFNKRFGEKLLLANNMLLISAPGEDSSNGRADDSSFPDSGVVYAYSLEQSPLDLSFSSDLKAFNPGAGDLFGSSMAMTDKFIAIGAPFEDNDKRSIINSLSVASDLDKLENDNRLNSGAVYIYSRNSSGSVISPYSYLKSSNSDNEDFFGASLAFADSSLFVGAPGEDGSGTGLNRDMQSNNAANAGSVYLFDHNQTGKVWFETAYIKADDNQPESAFGQFIGFDNNNLVISAPNFDDVLNENAGKVYLYSYKEGNIIYNQDFKPLGDTENQRLGKNLAIKNKHLILGASGFSGADDNIPFVGKVLTYQ